MRAAEELLAALSCPLAPSSVEKLLDMSDHDVLVRLAAWLEDVAFISPSRQLITAEPQADTPVLSGSFTHDGHRTTVAFRLVTMDDLGPDTTDVSLVSLVVETAGLTVLCMKVDPADVTAMTFVDRCVDLAGSPGPRWLVIEPAWLAAAVVAKTKPFVYPGMQDVNDSGEPYFTPSDRTGSHHHARLARASGSTRLHVNSVRLEPASLPEKIRELSLHSSVDECDTILATTFLPPVTHSATAVARYYSEHDDKDLVEQLVRARQEAERAVMRDHLAEFRQLLILDRQQIEEYYAEPEYYQMALTPDELDEQTANVSAMLDFDNLTVALCPEAVDMPFEVVGSDVSIRGDRRNKSEPRAGRVNGVTMFDDQLAEELRREASSLLELTEPQFQDKQFIARWLEFLAGNYRKQQRRSRR